MARLCADRLETGVDGRARVDAHLYPSMFGETEHGAAEPLDPRPAPRGLVFEVFEDEDGGAVAFEELADASQRSPVLVFLVVRDVDDAPGGDSAGRFEEHPAEPS